MPDGDDRAEIVDQAGEEGLIAVQAAAGRQLLGEDRRQERVTPALAAQERQRPARTAPAPSDIARARRASSAAPIFHTACSRVTTPAPRATVALEAARITAAARATSRPTTSASSRTPARGSAASSCKPGGHRRVRRNFDLAGRDLAAQVGGELGGGVAVGTNIAEGESTAPAIR
jgi:hypothetical protein